MISPKLGIALLAGFIVFAIALPSGVFWWARAVAASPLAPRFARYLPMTSVIVVVLMIIASALAVRALITQAAQYDAMTRAHVAADAIAEGTNCIALGTLLNCVVAALVAIAAVVVRLRRNG